MNKDIQHIKKLAFKYFNGCISPDEAAELFAYLEKSEAHTSIFRTLENEWLNDEKDSASLNHKWNAFENAREIREGIHSLVPLKKNNHRYFMVAASITLLIIAALAGSIHLYNAHSLETFYTMEVPYGQKSKVTLTDGSVVWLNSGSTLTYSNKFGKKHREVQLKGEGYFEVEKSKKEFIVKTANYAVVVKGTKFNVSAYPDDAYSSTTLLEGKVTLCGKRQIMNMSPGETLRLNLSSETFSRTNNGAANAKSWTKDRIEYDNIEFSELLKKLSRTYNQPILLMNDEIKNQRFSISIRNKQSLTEVLAAISKTIPINIKNENDTTKIK